MTEEQATKSKHGETTPRSCARCGFGNRPDAVYCGNCGANLVGKPCPACKALNPDDVHYCDRCGTWLDKPAQQRTLLSTFPVQQGHLQTLLAILAVIVVVCALFQFALATMLPGPFSTAIDALGAGLLVVGLMMGSIYVATARVIYSR